MHSFVPFSIQQRVVLDVAVEVDESRPARKKRITKTATVEENTIGASVAAAMKSAPKTGATPKKKVCDSFAPFIR